MKLYNYDYSDMKDISFSCDTREETMITSKVYPTKLEVKVEEETNRPYLYYEGIVQTNKGAMKVIFPKLDLVLDCASVQASSEEEKDFLGLRYRYKIDAYKITTEFNNVDDLILCEFKHFNDEDLKVIKEDFEKYNTQYIY